MISPRPLTTQRWIGVAVCAALLASCGSANGSNDQGRKRPPPLVEVAPVGTHPFANRIEAVGTARANEQVTVSANVTERILRLGFDDGQFVRRGQVLAVLAQGQESAQLREAMARQQEANRQLARIEALRKRGFATQSQLDVQSAAATAARAQASEVRADIGERVIRAPFSGYASLRNISAGAVVNAGTPITTISDISVIKLDFPVPETALPALRPGLAIDARSAAYPNMPFRGAISTIDTVVDPNSRAVTVRARLPNPNNLIRPGMLLNVTILTSPRIGLAVPELAVLGEGQDRFVFVVDKQGVAKRTQVRTGMRGDGLMEISSGLAVGDPVVTEGVVKLSDGMKVRLKGDARAGSAPGRAPQR